MVSQSMNKPRFNIRVREGYSSDTAAASKSLGRDILARCFLGLQVLPSLTPLHKLAQSVTPQIFEVSRYLNFLKLHSLSSHELFESNGSTYPIDYLMHQNHTSDSRTKQAVRYHESILSLRQRERSLLVREIAGAIKRETDQNAGRNDMLPQSNKMRGAAPTCILMTNDHKQPITRRKYRAILSRRERYDLFIDLTNPTDNGRYIAFGAHGQTELTLSEASVLIELIRCGIALHPNNIKSVNVEHRRKVIEKARKKIDEKIPKHGWRAFRTLKDGDNTRFQFNPPDNYCFVLVLPLHSE